MAGQGPPVAASSTTLATSELERDLALEMTRTTTDAADHERDVRVEVWLVNRSTSRSYPVVLANDGSEAGWREPHAFFTVELLRASGAWEQPPEAEGGRCGNYAEDWTRDVVALGPGQRVRMPWMPYRSPELGDATRIRVVAHYRYGSNARDKSKIPPELHPIPPYALASAPLEIPVEHPYSLELKVRGALPTTPGAPLASALDVIVENRSRLPLPIGTSETGAQLWFEAVVAIAANERSVPEEHTFSFRTDTTPTYPSTDTLAAGGKRSIVTPATKTDVVWSLPRGQLQRMRAVWRIWDNDDRGPGQQNANQHRVESPWVDLRSKGVVR